MAAASEALWEEKTADMQEQREQRERRERYEAEDAAAAAASPAVTKVATRPSKTLRVWRAAGRLSIRSNQSIRVPIQTTGCRMRRYSRSG